MKLGSMAIGLMDNSVGVSPATLEPPQYHHMKTFTHEKRIIITASLQGKETLPEAESSDNYGWAVEDSPNERDIQFLRDRVIEYNFETTDIRDGRGLSIFARDMMGSVVAGLEGWTWGECMYIQWAWVREDLRYKGYGRKLLVEAEKQAVSRGCRQSVVNTHSFQAPGFYQKHGYEVIGIIEDYPVEHQSLYLRKSLD